MWHRLSNSSELGGPALHVARWLEVMQHHRPYWRRFVRRAGQHAMNQRLKTFKCQQFYLGMRSILQQNDMWPHQHAPPKPDHARDSHLPFGCMSCQRSFRSPGSEGAHMFRTHGEVQPVRFLFESTQCAACLQEYYTHGKMKLHLLRSQGCRANLIAHGGRHAPVPGHGSDEDRRRHLQHDGRLPPLQAAGPVLPPPRARDMSLIHWEMHDRIAEVALQLDTADDFLEAARSVIHSTEISWTRCRLTLQEFLTTLETETEPFRVVPLQHAQQCLHQLCQSEAWPFLQKDSSDPAVRDTSLDILEDQFSFLESLDRMQPPRMIGKHRVLLHAFSGRRRPGDVQFFLEHFQQHSNDGTVLHVVSLDLMTDAVWGDATKPSTQRFWRDAADRRMVHAFLAGPPCETWSQARFAQHLANKGPRPIRGADMLWGLEALSLRELDQILIGNGLLHFSFDMLLRLYFSQGCGIIEHPDLPEEGYKPSIWRLPIMALFRALEGFMDFFH